MDRKPLVFVNGEVSEMPAGDLIDPAVLPAVEPPPAPPAVDFSLVSLVNGTAFTRPPCSPVYVKPDGQFGDASPSDPDQAEVVGLTTASVDSGLPVDVKTHGPMEAPEASWNAQTGLSGGLVAGSDYYLRNGGGLTVNPTGPHVTKLGKALSSTKLLVRIEPTVSLS